MDKNVFERSYEKEMKQSYINYSMSVVMGRALPDVRDGLKPVHRRILFTMDQLNLHSNKPHRKSARIVGDGLGKYHPHGDTSLYEAMVRMSQEFLLPLPLVDGHGNFGSIDGDSPAAMRYTEARLTEIAEGMLKDLKYDTVEFKNNFDDTLKEPTLLPSLFPNLLVNGSNGIAVGMATSIPTHNFSETTKTYMKYIENKDSSTSELLKTLKGPDFPTGGVITNKKDLNAIYRDGHGKIKIRAKVDIEKGINGKVLFVITEIPYTYSGNLERLIEILIEKSVSDKLSEVLDIKDESSSEGIRIVVETKRGTDKERFINKLYKHTPLEDTMGVNFLALNGVRPIQYNLHTYFEDLLKFHKEITERKHIFLINKKNKELEYWDALKTARLNIDVIIDIVKNAENKEDMMNCLVKGETKNINFSLKKHEKESSKFKYSEYQAETILKTTLLQLSKLEEEKIEENIKNIKTSLKNSKEIIQNEESIEKEIMSILVELLSKFGRKRRTKIMDDEIKDFKEVKIFKPSYILIDKLGYVKRVSPETFERNKESILNSYYLQFFMEEESPVKCFTVNGDVYTLKPSTLQIKNLSDKSLSLYHLLNIKDDSIKYITPYASDKKIIFITENGLGKMVSMKDYETNRVKIVGTKIREGDRILYIKELLDEKIYIFTADSYILKFKAEQFPTLGKTAAGNRIINLNKNSKVIDALYDTNLEETFSLIDINNKENIVQKSEVNCSKIGLKGSKVLKKSILYIQKQGE